MNKTNETSVTLQAIQLLKGILSKPALLRSDQEKDQITQILEDINYFRRYANDSTQRREFIGEISEHLKFAYYPKGTLIYNNGEYGANFGVILRGHAIVYAPKKKGDLEKELLSPGKYGKLVELYNKYVEGENYQRKQKKWKQLFATSGRRVAIVGGLEHSPSGKPLSLNGSAKNLHEIENSMRTVTNEVLSQNNSVFTASGNTKDLTLEDKLLVLHHNKANKNFFKDGVATYKKQRDVRGGDTIAEVCLTTDLTIDHSVIAAEDLYVITISKDHFRSVVMGKSVNLEEKKSLFWKMFPQLTIESIIKLCAYVEERIIVNWDTVYREGDEADAIYIVKTGEVQLVTFDKEEKIDPLELPLGMTQKPKRHHNTHKLIVGSIEVGGIFGEDEVINKGKRKHTAICNSALTLLYVLKKHTFYELFEKYFSYIANEFKSILDAKSTWRARRIEQERKMAEEARNQDLPPSLHVENVAVKSARLMKETEAEYRRIKVDRPELVMETKTTNVIKYEQRKSRVYNNRVDILVYDTSNMPKEETGMETISPLKKMHQKHSSSSLDLRKGSKKSPKKYATKIEKVKSNLFEQNQDFVRWKKYYDALFTAQSPPKGSRNSIAINSISQLKPTEPDNVQRSQPFKRRSFPKLTITTEAADSRTHLEPVRTLNELATPSENNIPTLTCMTNPSVILQVRNNRYMSTSPQILSPPRIKDQGEESTRLTPGSARFFKRIVSAKPRRSSVDYDGPSSSTNSINQIGSLNFLDEPITLSKSSVQPHSTRASMTTHSPIPSAFAREKNKPMTVVVPRGQGALSERLNQLFVANRGKEDPKVMVLKRELPTRVQTSMGSRPGSKMSGKIKTIKRGDSLTNF